MLLFCFLDIPNFQNRARDLYGEFWCRCEHHYSASAAFSELASLHQSDEFYYFLVAHIPQRRDVQVGPDPLVVDTLKPACRWGRYLSTMPRKTYTERFKHDAVSLYESTPGATINAIASDLGVNRNSLRSWLDTFGTGTKTNANGEKVASPIAASDSATAASGLSDAERIRVLERENAKLREEREILRKAAKYFAKETNW